MSDAIIRKELQASKDPTSSTFTAYAGDTLELTFIITGDDDEPIDLTGWTSLKYKLHPQSGGDVWPGGKDITPDSDQVTNKGKATLLLSATDTGALANGYTHFLVLEDAAGNVGTFMSGQATFVVGGV